MNSPTVYPETVRLAYWLRHPETWPRVIQALKDRQDTASVEGLIELLYRPPSAKAALAAIEALEPSGHASVIDAFQSALSSPHVYVRMAALRSLQQRQAWTLAPVVSRRLDRDPSWLVRRAALRFLSQSQTTWRWQILKASSDPHWRVRHALIQVLLGWIEIGEDRHEIVRRLSAGTDVRTQGIQRYLDFRLTGQFQEPFVTEQEDPASWCEFWDWDPAVLAWRLEQMSAQERLKAIAIMPRLIGHEDERVRRFAAIPLRRDGQVDDLLKTLRWLDDPRHESYETVVQLMEQLDWQRAEQLVQSVPAVKHPTPGQWNWALGQIEVTVSLEDIPHFPEICRRAMDEGPKVRAALARTLSLVPIRDQQDLFAALLQDPDPDVVLTALQGIARRPNTDLVPIQLTLENVRRLLKSDDPEMRSAVAAAIVLNQELVMSLLPQLVSDPCSSVRVLAAEWLKNQTDSSHNQWLSQLQSDECSLVRAAALTQSRAKELLENPASETSWLVLEQVERLCKTPLWNIAPEELSKETVDPQESSVFLTIQKQARLPFRQLVHWQVSPLGISGHYGLPVEGFVRAMEAGVNLMFWEPNYHTLSTFMGRLPMHERSQIRMVTGTFEADPSRIQKDVERALNMLQIEQIPVFLLFWTRSWNRITESVRKRLDQLQQAGKIGAYGLSTHSRPLAVEAMESGWNPVMVRHSAAHLGAESLIFPKALELGTHLLTFNNTCYGRLSDAFPANSGLSAADCYRYTLSFDAVTACWSAPSTIDELEINLEVLHSPELPLHRRELLLEAGGRVYQEDTIFRQLVRGV